ncbi:GTPase-associated system all-helical protein GASH [Flintibacter sp. KGMB00164]|uniref:GTPase-associated system all-helical protein GASH n=1 Tax=Flintibacter sp. KGMB00164 TaxID=2610895 RepID=UPI00124586D9|nr:GTPase-associated system all-helical protein GASH [Flintibacter sp. KGMB00164]
MIKNFNEWYIDVNLAPQEGLIEKRLECIADYAKSVDANDICNLVNLYYGLTTDKEDLESFASVFIEKDPSFSSRYTKELSLLAGATLLEISTENIDYSSFAELLTLTTSFYKKPSSAPRALEQIIKRFNIDRIGIREKSFTDDTLDFDKANLKTVATTINKPSWDATSAQNLIHVLGECVDYLDVLCNRLNTMQKMQSVYEEDSQLLWWMMSDWSTTLNQPLKEIEKINGCLLVAYEAACFVSNYPGPYAMEGVIRKVVNACKGRTQNIEFTKLITEINPTLKKIIASKAKLFPAIEQLPITYAILCADNAADITEWYPKYCRTVSVDENIEKDTCEKYAWQMYLECLALSCFETLSK